MNDGVLLIQEMGVRRVVPEGVEFGHMLFDWMHQVVETGVRHLEPTLLRVILSNERCTEQLHTRPLFMPEQAMIY